MKIILSLLFCLPIVASTQSVNYLAEARANYQRGEFARFFGLTQWARLNGWPALGEDERDQWQALELLALARHCAWAPVHALAAGAAVDLPRTRQALEFIRLKEGYRRFENDARDHARPFLERIIVNRSRWAVSPGEFSRMTNPLNLRAKVRSLCGDS